MSRHLLLMLAAPCGAIFAVAYLIRYKHASIASILVLIGFLTVQWAAIIIFKRQQSADGKEAA